MRRSSWLVVVLALSGTAYADVDPQITAALARVKPSAYPSANSVVALSDQKVVYQPDGTYVATVHIATLVLTPAGKKGAATTSIGYTKNAEKLEVLSAQVVKADGSVVPVSPKDIQDVEQSGETTQMNIYDSNGRTVNVTFAGLGVGDVADITYRDTRTIPMRQGYFADTFAFQSDSPVLEASYVVDGPASLPLASAIYHPERAGKIDATKQTVGDRVHYKWSAHDVAQLVPETAMDPSSELPMLVVSTDPSWEHFSAWMAKLSAPMLVASPEVKAKVAELTKNAKTPDDKIKALYDFVAQDIRYRGGLGLLTGYEPRKAGDTLNSRWGVCRDVATLLTSMLRESGFEAYPALTNVGEPVLRKVAYHVFNHEIVAMPDGKGGWRYLDPTAKNNVSLLPGYEAEQDTLVVTDKGEPLGRTGALDPSENLGHATATTAIAADGSMTSTIKLQTKGIFDLAVRSGAAMMSTDEERETLEAILHHALPEAQLVDFSFSSPLALTSPMEVTATIKMPNAAPKTGDYRVLRSIVTSGALGLVDNFLPRILGADPTRKYGLDAQVTFEYDQDETITLPAGMKIVALPNVATSSNKTSELAATCTSKDATTVVCHRSFSLKSRFIDTSAYKQLRSSLAVLGQIARQPVILSGGPS